MSSKRRRRIDLDILKAIGSLCIILAHTAQNSIILQIRNSDVVLLILISAYLGLLTYKNSSYLHYLFKRFKRLVIPVWILLAVYFIINLVLQFQSISSDAIVDSFILNNGIGYVWIIRIYLLIALLVPVCREVINLKRDFFTISTAVILYILYEALYHFGALDNPTAQYFFAYLIPCYCLIIAAHYLFNASTKKLLIFCILSALTTIALGYYFYKTTGQIQFTQIQKYPFRSYYLSYALFASSLLMLLCRHQKLLALLNKKPLLFISKNSLWIYLWHILFLYLLTPLSLHWLLKFVIVTGLSCLAVFAQSRIVQKLTGKIDQSALDIFTG